MAQLSSDQPRQTITAEGASKELGLAAWLVNEFDRSMPSHDSMSLGHEYMIPDNTDDLTVVLRDIRIGMPVSSTEAARDAAPQDVDEIAGAFRSLCDLQRVIAYTPQGALVWRGTAWQTRLALSLLEAIANPPGVNWTEPTSFTLDEIIAPKTLDKDIPSEVRIFYFPPNVTAQKLGAIANAIRSGVHTQRVNAFIAVRAIVLRGTDEQAADAERIVEEARH
jgi:hypothetical protein